MLLWLCGCFALLLRRVWTLWTIGLVLVCSQCADARDGVVVIGSAA
jgi:hypothetical protein